MATGVRLFTVEDLEAFPEDGNRYEVIAGELYVSHAPHLEHQLILDQVTTELHLWQDRDGLGMVVSGAGLIFSRQDGVIPDLMWFGDEQLPEALINPATGERDGKCYQAPTLAVEVLSAGPANESRDRETKLTLYSRRGVREYWIIDRFARAILVYRRTAEAALDLAATLTDRDTLASPLLPGFALPVAQLFQLPRALRR